jgi:hypothetical protein
MEIAANVPVIPAYQQRVLQEREELNERIIKLVMFIATRSDEVPEDEQKRLDRQLWIMGQYSAVLLERIEAFPKVA